MVLKLIFMTSKYNRGTLRKKRHSEGMSTILNCCFKVLRHFHCVLLKPLVKALFSIVTNKDVCGHLIILSFFSWFQNLLRGHSRLHSYLPIQRNISPISCSFNVISVWILKMSCCFGTTVMSIV